jgi:cytochrome c biogenesis protein CcmG/thiol:disulfide interchange protein DsbE
MSDLIAAERMPARRRKGMAPVLVMPMVTLAILLATPAAGQVIDPLMLGLVPIGKPVPEFDLPPVQGRTLGLSDRDLKGDVSVVNVFASWCGPCREEHPLLMDLASHNTVPIHGLNYKDRPDSARRWLKRLGDPYTRTGADRDGRVATDFGLFGVPQTFVVDQTGRIAYVHIGALDDAAIEETLLPIVEKLRARREPATKPISTRSSTQRSGETLDGATEKPR